MKSITPKPFVSRAFKTFHPKSFSRAITPVVAVVVLTLMTVAASGMAYLTITTYQSDVEGSSQGGIESLATSTQSKLKIESVSGGRIYLRNLGDEKFENPSFYVDGRPLNVSGLDECEAGKTCVYVIMETDPCDGEATLSMGADMPIGTEVTTDCEEDLEPEELLTIQYITTFSDSSSEKTLVFTNQGFEIVNITLPLTATISSANLDLSGNKSWSVEVNVSENSGISYWPKITVDSSDNPHIAWRDSLTGDEEIFYRNRTNGIWSEVVNVSNRTSNSKDPSLVIDKSDNLHILWAEFMSDYEVFYKNQTSSGWSDRVNVSNNTGYSNFPQIAVDSSNNLHVVWDEQPGTIDNVYYKNRTSSGWSENVTVSSSGHYPFLAIDSNDYIHFIWELSDVIYYRNLTNVGWSSTENLGSGNEPILTIDSNDNLHAVFYVSGEIYYRNRTSSGWSSTDNISQNTGTSQRSRITVDTLDNLHVIWRDNDPGNDEILYKNRTNGVWSSAENLSQNSGVSYEPYLTADHSGNVHIVWVDYSTGNDEIYHKQFSFTENSNMVAGSTGSSDWSYSNYFNNTSSVSDFSTKLNNIVSTLSCVCGTCWSNGTHCTVGLNFTTQSAGKIQLSNLQITYT